MTALPSLPPLAGAGSSSLPPLSAPALPPLAIPSDAAGPMQPIGSHIDRLDPFWDGLWPIGSAARWRTAATDRQQITAGTFPRTRPAPMEREQIEQVLGSLSLKSRNRLICTCSALDSWGQMTATQMQHLIGTSPLNSQGRLHRELAALYSLGAIDVGSLGEQDTPETILLRYGRKDYWRKLLTPYLTQTELMMIDGGVVGTPRIGYHDRHNTLTVEFALRAATLLESIEAAYGEKFSSTAMMAPQDYIVSGFTPGAHRQPARADATLVRSDGLRIVLETTANSSKSLRTKVRRWARFLDRHPMHRMPVFVLFVAAPHPGRDGRVSAGPSAKIRDDITDELKTLSSLGPNAAAARIGVAGWEEFFPSRHEVSDAFTDLRVRVRQGGWSEISLMQMPVQIEDPAAARGAIAASRLLAASPWWLRTGDHTHLVGTPADRLTDGVFPVPAHKHSGGKPPPFHRASPPRRVRVIGLTHPSRTSDERTPVR